MLPVGMLAAVLLAAWPATVAAEPLPSKPREFANGFPNDPQFFPIGVWLQNPRNAGTYHGIGINTFIGLWGTPTAEHLAELNEHGLYLIAEPTPAARSLPNAHVIRAWMQTDEPDNAQADGRGGYGDCIMPGEVVRRYQGIKALDATRPVFLNFGQAVANAQWIGRGSKCSQISPQSYYTAGSRGADIVAFDIYPAVEDRQAHVKGKLELVGRGVANLKSWSPPGQPVWNAIETTHIYNPSRRPLPHEIRSEVWMSLIHGSTGIYYFVHEWKPSFREDGVFRYHETVEEITRINSQIRMLAPVLNSPTLAERVRIEAPVEIATMVKHHGDAYYVFAVNMQNKSAKVRLMLSQIPGDYAVVLGEGRIIRFEGAVIQDEFAGYGVRLYKILEQGQSPPRSPGNRGQR
jgi:hypothetical protein